MAIQTMMLDPEGKTHNEVRARRFVLVDENGKTRATLNVDKAGPGLNLYDENEKIRASLSVMKGGPCLCLYDKLGKRDAPLRWAQTRTGRGWVFSVAESALVDLVDVLTVADEEKEKDE